MVESNKKDFKKKTIKGLALQTAREHTVFVAVHILIFCLIFSPKSREV